MRRGGGRALRADELHGRVRQTQDTSAWPLTERSPVGPQQAGPVRGYGWSKLAAERLLARAVEAFGFDSVVIRPATCYGPDRTFSRTLVRSALAGPVRKESRRVLQYLHVDDASRMIAWLALGAPDGEVVHIAGTDALPWPRSSAGPRGRRRSLSWGHAAALSRFTLPYDLSRARKLGLFSTTGLAEGLRDLAATVLADDAAEEAAQDEAENARATPGHRPRRALATAGARGAAGWWE